MLLWCFTLPHRHEHSHSFALSSLLLPFVGPNQWAGVWQSNQRAGPTATFSGSREAVPTAVLQLQQQKEQMQRGDQVPQAVSRVQAGRPESQSLLHRLQLSQM